MTRVVGAAAFVVVVGHGPDLERQDGAANLLRGLGARVRCLDLWDDPASLELGPHDAVRAVVFEAMDRPDLAAAVLSTLRREPALSGAGALVAVSHRQVAGLDPAAGFDDFVLVPYVPAELYARLRSLEWQRSEFSTEARIKVGDIVIDRLGHQVTVAGVSVALTTRELALLVLLCEQRGRVVSRERALAHAWGHDYLGGDRTVDIHVRRLRQKLGDSLPLVTVRGAGYKVEVPAEAGRGRGRG